jgi:hypothetical protein
MLRKLVIVAVMAVMASGTSITLAGGKGGSEKKASYLHNVIFYLKKDAPENAAQSLIEDSHKLLAKIPTVKHLWVGRPAKDATPKVAVTDYAVGLTIAFDNYEGLKTYLDHDLHTQYLKNNGKFIEKVLVYDFVNQMK